MLTTLLASAVLLLAAYSAFMTWRNAALKAELIEALDAYNASYILGHNAGLQAAEDAYKKRVPYTDGYSDGYKAAKEKQGQELEIAS